MLWAWQRPEDLRFAGGEVGTAALVGTIRIRAGALHISPRLNPLRTAPHSQVLPVVRVELDRGPGSGSGAQNAEALASAIVDLVRGPAVQVDFDAALSERPLARELLAALRRRLPAPSFVSATVLVSSCFDGSAALLPADELVPMVFRLGPEGPAVRRRVARHGLPPPCDRAMGVASDEPAIVIAPGARLYLFAPRAWDAPLLQSARRKVRR
jgi:hypothetical protein